MDADLTFESFNANAVAWAVARWDAEVAQRPLVNVHRRSLDDAWRQVIRHFGGDPDKLIGPSHDTLLMREQEARAWRSPGTPGCNCPGEGKRDERLHARNCPYRTTPDDAGVKEGGSNAA